MFYFDYKVYRDIYIFIFIPGVRKLTVPLHEQARTRGYYEYAREIVSMAILSVFSTQNGKPLVADMHLCCLEVHFPRYLITAYYPCHRRTSNSTMVVPHTGRLVDFDIYINIWAQV